MILNIKEIFKYKVRQLHRSLVYAIIPKISALWERLSSTWRGWWNQNHWQWQICTVGREDKQGVGEVWEGLSGWHYRIQACMETGRTAGDGKGPRGPEHQSDEGVLPSTGAAGAPRWPGWETDLDTSLPLLTWHVQLLHKKSLLEAT